MLALIVTLWETMLFIDSRLHVVVSGTASTLDENNGGRQRGKRSSYSSSLTRQNNMQGSLSGHNSPDELTLLLLPVRQIGSQVSQLCRHNSSLD